MSFTRRSDQRTITIPSTIDEFTARYSETGTQSNLSFYDAFILPGQEKLTTSGSVVKAQALLAFRVVPMLGLHPRDVIPAWEKIPVSSDPDCRDMLNKLCAASSIDLGSVSLSRNNADNPELHNLIRLMQLERDVPDPFFPTPLDIDGATTFARKSMSQFITNPFLTVFLSLRDLRTRRLAEHYEDVRDGASVATKSGVTGESDEDKNEVASEELLHRLMDIVLVYYSRKTKDQDWLRSTGAQLQLSCSFECSREDLKEFRRVPAPKGTGKMEEEGPRQRSNSNPGNLESEGKKQAAMQLEQDKKTNLDKASTNQQTAERIKFTAKDDGYMYLARAGKKSGGNRFSKIPVVRYEAKRLVLPGLPIHRQREEQLGKEREFFKSATSQAIDVKEGEKMGEELLKLVAQQYAEMLTGIYVNLHYAADYDTRARLVPPESEDSKKKINKEEKSLKSMLDSKGKKAAATAAPDPNFFAEEVDDCDDPNMTGSETEMLSTKPADKKQDKKETKIKTETETETETKNKTQAKTKKEAKGKKESKKLPSAKFDGKIHEIKVWRNQEAFTIHLRHTYISFSRVELTKAYLQDVAKEAVLDKKHQVEYLQTKEFDLLYAHDRYEAGRALWGLIDYLHQAEEDERPMIGRLQTEAKQHFQKYFPVEHHDGREDGDEPDGGMRDGGPNGIQRLGTGFSSAVLQAFAATIPNDSVDKLLERYNTTDSVPGLFVAALKKITGSTSKKVAIRSLVLKGMGYDEAAKIDAADFVHQLFAAFNHEVVHPFGHKEQMNILSSLFQIHIGTRTVCARCGLDQELDPTGTRVLTLQPSLEPQVDLATGAPSPQSVEVLVKKYLERHPESNTSFWCHRPHHCFAQAQEMFKLNGSPGPELLLVQISRSLTIDARRNQYQNGLPLEQLKQVRRVHEKVAAKLAVADSELAQFETDARSELETLSQKKQQGDQFLPLPMKVLSPFEEKRKALAVKLNTVGEDVVRREQMFLSVKPQAPLDLFDELLGAKPLRLIMANTSTKAQSRVFYDLYAIVSHRGETVQSGNYWAYTLYEDKWYKCVNETVTEMSNEQMVSELEVACIPYQIGEETKHHWEEKESGVPYLLFYRRSLDQTQDDRTELFETLGSLGDDDLPEEPQSSHSLHEEETATPTEYAPTLSGYEDSQGSRSGYSDGDSMLIE